MKKLKRFARRVKSAFICWRIGFDIKTAWAFSSHSPIQLMPSWSVFPILRPQWLKDAALDNPWTCTRAEFLRSEPAEREDYEWITSDLGELVDSSAKARS